MNAPKPAGLNGSQWQPIPTDLASAALAGKPEALTAYLYLWTHYNLGGNPTVREVVKASGLTHRKALKLVTRAAAEWACWAKKPNPARKARGGKRTETAPRMYRKRTESVPTEEAIADTSDDIGTKTDRNGTESVPLVRAILPSTVQSTEQTSSKDDSPPTVGQQARDIWAVWEPKRAEVYQGRATKKMPRSHGQHLTARVRESGREDVITVLAWWLTSNHKRAVFLRAEGCSWSTMLRPGNFATYLEMATSKGPAAGPTAQADESGAVWTRVVTEIGTLGPSDACRAAPPRVQHALKAAGGTHQLARLSQYDLGAARRTFCDAYRAWVGDNVVNLREVAK